MQKLLTVNEAAEVLAVHPKTLYRWIALRRFPVVRVERTVRIAQKSLDDYLAKKAQPAEF
jgi:excisionase family DNA binding protein